MNPISKTLLGIVAFVIFMLPALVILWLNLLQRLSFDGGVCFLASVLFVIGCIFEVLLIVEGDE